MPATSLWPKHKCGMTLSHNGCRGVYQTAAQHIENMEAIGSKFNWPSSEERQKAMNTNELWELQWHPDTPAGCYCAAAASFEALMEYVIRENWK